MILQLQVGQPQEKDLQLMFNMKTALTQGNLLKGIANKIILF